MKFRVVIARKAALEIEEQFNWLVERSESVAVQWKLSLLEAIESLENNPDQCAEARKPNGMKACVNFSTANAASSIAFSLRFGNRR
jgi:plasmid stabilization system protein ParE